MHPRERAIREKRTNEAILKNFVGPDGKLGMIARYLGSPIIRQGSGLYDASYLDDPYAVPDENSMPIFDEESAFVETGTKNPTQATSSTA